MRINDGLKPDVEVTMHEKGPFKEMQSCNESCGLGEACLDREHAVPLSTDKPLFTQCVPVSVSFSNYININT